MHIKRNKERKYDDRNKNGVINANITMNKLNIEILTIPHCHELEKKSIQVVDIMNDGYYVVYNPNLASMSRFSLLK